jgi:hypothetical protein
MRIKSITLKLLLGFTVILAITNPSPGSFKEILPLKTGMSSKVIDNKPSFCYGRSSNWFIFSFYNISYKEHGAYPLAMVSYSFVGILGNFYMIDYQKSY